jgi:hypothetical protein
MSVRRLAPAREAVVPPAELAHAPSDDGRLYSPVRRLVIPDQVADEDLALINRTFARTPLAPEDVFTFRGVISSDAPDSYYTHMDVKTSLRNFARDAADGRALLDSHDMWRLPIGQSFAGEVQPVEGGSLEGVPATMQVEQAWYLLRGHMVDGKATDDYIRGILGGIYRRMSIGFGGSELEIVCDEDGSDIWDWDSEFYPGQKLPDGRTVLYTIKNARELEGSLVYKNSTPGALTSRVAELVRRRRIAPSEARRLGDRWGVRFDLPGLMVPGVTLERSVPTAGLARGGTRMDPEELRALLERVQTRVGKKLSAATQNSLKDCIAKLGTARGGMEEVETALADLLKSADAATTDDGDDDDRAALAALPAEHRSDEGVRTLLTRAAAGERYTEHIIGEAVKARVAVAGRDVDADKYRSRLRAAAQRGDLEFVEDELAAWSKQRGEVYTPGRMASRTDPNAHAQGNGLTLEIEERNYR